MVNVNQSDPCDESVVLESALIGDLDMSDYSHCTSRICKWARSLPLCNVSMKKTKGFASARNISFS